MALPRGGLRLALVLADTHRALHARAMDSTLGVCKRFSSSRLYRTSASVRSNGAAVSGKVDIYGGEIYFERRGSGPRALVCIPGALGTVATDFAPQMEYFGREGSGYTVVTFDPRGYGASRPPERDFATDYEHFMRKDAHDAFGVMNTLGLLRFSVLGWSDGGNAAVSVAARFPRAVTELIIWGANAYVSDEDVAMFERLRDVANWSARMREPFEAIYGREGFPKLWGDWVDSVVRLGRERENASVCLEELPDVKCPTLVLHGRKDPVCPLFHAEFLHRQIKQSELFLFPEGKHNIHLRYAQEFNTVVDQFLRKRFTPPS